MLNDLSVIIPTLNTGEALSRLVGRLEDVGEVIISDGWSTEPPVGPCVISGQPGRGGQLVRGAGAAQGRWLLFLHADSELPEGWEKVVAAHMASQQSAAAFRLRFDSTGLRPRIVETWANLRSRMGLPYGDQGLLIPADLYAHVGGHPDIPLMEDVAIARALGGRITLLPAELTTSGTKYERDGWFRRGARNLWTLLRYLMGADPARLAAEYRRRDQA